MSKVLSDSFLILLERLLVSALGCFWQGSSWSVFFFIMKPQAEKEQTNKKDAGLLCGGVIRIVVLPYCIYILRQTDRTFNEQG